MKPIQFFVGSLALLMAISLTPSTITYAQNSPSETPSDLTYSKTTEKTASSSSEFQDRLNTLAGIWIQAQNIKKQLESLSTEKPTPNASTTNEERAIAKIVEYSMEYGVPAKDLYAIVKCESQFNPNARNYSEKEDSWSWVQINRKAHPHISVAQAKDLDFAIPFLAKNWSEGRKWMWENCSRKHGLL